MRKLLFTLLLLLLLLAPQAQAGKKKKPPPPPPSGPCDAVAAICERHGSMSEECRLAVRKCNESQPPPS